MGHRPSILESLRGEALGLHGAWLFHQNVRVVAVRGGGGARARFACRPTPVPQHVHTIFSEDVDPMI